MNPMMTPEALVGRTLGGFLIQSQLGAGGMGVVYRARDERLKRTVAIKVLHAKCIADDAVRERFLREGRTAASIDHPNVVRVLAAGEEDGIPYLVMEYVEGGTLEKILERRECLSPARCLRIAKQIAEALAAAHRVGVMHRDVKPANVLFTNDGEPKLTDFGLARERTGGQRVSETGIVLGTPHYMSPEACEGGHSDARSDVYSLGVVLYAMLEQRLPFMGDSHARILISQIQDPVPPLTQAPPALKQVVYRALEKNPSDRWSSASEFAAALERVLEEFYFPSVPGACEDTPVRGSTASWLPANPLETDLFGAKASASMPRPPPARGTRRRRVVVAIGSVVSLLVAAVFLAPFFGRRVNASPARPAEVVSASQPDPVVVKPDTVEPVPAEPVPEEPAPAVEQPALAASEREEWEAEFQRIAEAASVLEAAGEFTRALETWGEFHPASENGRAAQGRARQELLEKSAARVQRALLAGPRGPKAAAELRALALRTPESERAPLFAAAVVAEQGWAPADGFEGLRSGFARHAPGGLRAEFDAAEAGASAEDRVRIESARIAVSRLDLLVGRAFARYRSRRGQVLEIQRTDGHAVRGTLQAVDEVARRIYIDSAGTLVNLSAADLASREISARALEENPPDEVLLAALDLLLLAGQPQEAWPVAFRARRRGLTIEPDREALLSAQIHPADLTAAVAALGEIHALRGEPARLRAASRDWLRKYRFLPLDLSAAGAAREAMRRCGGAVNAEDLELYSAARVTGSAKSFSMEYDSPEAVLADFQPSGRFCVEPGEVATLSPARTPIVQLLAGLAWKEGVIEMKLRTESTFTVLIGWRGPGEHFEFVLSPAPDGKVTVVLPLQGVSFDTVLPADGWIEVRLAWASGRISVRANGVTRECPLPRDWSGEIGFAPGGSWSWRSLRVYGQAEFEAPAPAPGGGPAPRVRRAVPASWGAWSSPAGVEDELTILSQDGLKWAVPAPWEAGNDYRAVFRVRVSEGATVAFDFGAGDGRRRVVLGVGGASGFVAGRDLVRSGHAPEIPVGREIAVEIVVHRGAARIVLDGAAVWTGHLNASSKGGLSVGVSGGEVTFKDLELWELEP